MEGDHSWSCSLAFAGADAKPAGEYRQKSPESAAQPMLIDGTVIDEGTEVTPAAVERASAIAAQNTQHMQ